MFMALAQATEREHPNTSMTMLSIASQHQENSPYAKLTVFQHDITDIFFNEQQHEQSSN
eukprot:CCRYP_012070-RA/>CCRYP_012070-RA protein AED:0.00 eAED:0.00 QI:108/1/1/1/0/0/2/134/58